jgi:prepilin-type N-terminal cleavage/methylation domain-containing protein
MTMEVDPGRRGERGFSLIEVMVTLTITAIIMAGAFRAYLDGTDVVTTSTMLGDANQNLRSSINLISRDLIQTGRELPNGGIPFPSGVGALAIRRPGPPGQNLVFPVSFDGVLPSICPGPNLGPVIGGNPAAIPPIPGIATDLVTTLFADATLDLNQFPLASIQADGSKMTVAAGTVINNAVTGLRPGDLIWFTNAVGDAIQTVSSVVGQDVFFAANDAFRFNQRGAASGTIMQIRTGAVFPPTSATRVTMVTYYIDTVTVPGQFRLMRQVNFGNPQLIAPGIDNLQATYDIVDGTVNPTNQPDAVDPYNPVQIRKVNLYLAARSDARLPKSRQVLHLGVSTQISLRAMSFVDRYQ